MSRALTASPGGVREGLRYVFRAWGSLRWQEAAVFTLAGLLFGLIDLTSLIELRSMPGLAGAVVMHLLGILVACAALTLCWLPAARSDSSHPHRRWRLLGATLLGATVAVAVMQPLLRSLPWHTICDLFSMSKGYSGCTEYLWTDWLGNTLWVCMPALLMVGLFEARQQRQLHERLAHALLLEHEQLKREALSARLATMQAQVEPGLLFEALIGIQQAYAEGDREAGERIERLIRHLRMALPRLHERSASLAQELELAQTYLDVVRDLRSHAPRLELPADMRPLALPPMALLPLVQRAVRLHCPSRCWIVREGRRLSVGFDSPGLCSEDAELQALRERLAVLDVRLRCETDAVQTIFHLELPP